MALSGRLIMVTILPAAGEPPVFSDKGGVIA
jgi:hypothetical protein